MRDPSELTSQDKKNIPPFAKIQGFYRDQDWVTKYNYPHQIKKADYYVKYLTIEGITTYALIESSKKELKYKIKQLRTSAEMFNQLKKTVDKYIIVLDTFNTRSIRGFATVKSKSPYFLNIKRKQGRSLLNIEKIYNKEILLCYRKHFDKISGLNKK